MDPVKAMEVSIFFQNNFNDITMIRSFEDLASILIDDTDVPVMGALKSIPEVSREESSIDLKAYDKGGDDEDDEYGDEGFDEDDDDEEENGDDNASGSYRVDGVLNEIEAQSEEEESMPNSTNPQISDRVSMRARLVVG